jgi:hypothetical protein
MEEETITISKKKYDKLVKQSEWLGYLNAAGVDNWEGYGVAQDYRDEAEGVKEDEEDPNS